MSVSDGPEICPDRLLTPEKKLPKVIYTCNLCGVSFKCPGQLETHLGQKIACFQRRDIGYLKSKLDIRDYDEVEMILNQEIILFYDMCRKAKHIDDFNACRQKMSKIRKIYTRLLAYCRILCFDPAKPYDQTTALAIDNLLAAYNDKIEEMRTRYKLLII